MHSPHLTSLESDGWMIDDGEVAHAESPDTYWIPPFSDRQSVRAGDLAKIRFYIRVADDKGDEVDHGERMWVQVAERVGSWYRGVLENQPYCTDDIAPGLEVWFEPRHIIDIQRGDTGA